MTRAGPRAARKDDALAGLERWKARWPAAAEALEEADVLVDSMRGRSTTWTRVRVNLIHVAEDDRPPQEPLDPDYDPWVDYEGPDRSGQIERATRMHQNLVDRTDLGSDQRVTALYELAQDYLKAGLLDRAEEVFVKLRDTQHRGAALKALLVNRAAAVQGVSEYRSARSS